MFKITVFVSAILFFMTSFCFAQDEITITTYYPSPHGVYGTLRLYPSADDPGTKTCSGNEIGAMYYHDGSVGTEGVYVCDGNNWQPSGGGAGEVPSGMIAMFDTSCPAGWTRFEALDGLFPRGASSYDGAARGTTSHTHSYSGNTNSFSHWTRGRATGGASTLMSPSRHSHSYSGTTGSADHLPPYLDVIWCKKD